jgi:hypothetical protein
MFGIALTQHQLETYGWAAGIGDAWEIVARNALLVFLLVSALLQILFVAPRFKFFSVSGRIHNDVKPTVLVFLLLGLLALVFWTINEFGNEFTWISEFGIMILPLNVYLAIIGFVLAWFFLTRWVLMEGFLERFTHISERLYSLQLRSIHRKQEKRRKRERQDQ